MSSFSSSSPEPNKGIHDLFFWLIIINELKRLFRFLVAYVCVFWCTRTLNRWDWPTCCRKILFIPLQSGIDFSESLLFRMYPKPLDVPCPEPSRLGLIEGAGCRSRDTPTSSNLSEEYNYYSTSMQIGLFVSRSDSLAACELWKSRRVTAFFNILCLIPFKSSI